MNIKNFLRSLKKNKYMTVLDQNGMPLAISLKEASIDELGPSFSNTMLDAGIYPSKSTITYALNVPKLSSKDTLLAIQNYIIEQLGEEISSDSTLVFLEQKISSSNRTVSAVLAQNKPLEEWLEQQKAKDFFCRWYLPKSLCLQAFYEKYGPKERTVFLIDYQESEITLLYFQKTSLLACRTLPIALEQDTTAILQQIMTSLLSWDEEKEPLVILTGGNESWETTAKGFITYETYTPEEALELFFRKASCVGAALLAQNSLTDIPPPALASSEKRPYISSWKTTLIIATILSLLASLFFVFRESRQEKTLKTHVEEELVLLQKQPWTSSLPKALPVEVQEYELLLEEMDQAKSILKKQILFPLKPSLPTLSSVIGWLNEQIARVCSPQDTIEIQKLTYILVQYPTIDQMQKRYQLRLDVELFSPNPQIARHLHEILLVPNDMISLKNDVKWNATGTLYKTSFFIQDKTRYSQVQ